MTGRATRRAVLAGMGANALAGGSCHGGNNPCEISVLPTVGKTPPNDGADRHPDAKLLALCAHLRTLEDEWNRLYAATSDDDELTTAADRAWQDYSDNVWPGIRLAARRWRNEAPDPADLVNKLLTLHATTLDGMRAKAAAILSMDDAGCWCDSRDDAYDFHRNLLRDAAGIAWRPMADGTEPHA